MSFVPGNEKQHPYLDLPEKGTCINNFIVAILSAHRSGHALDCLVVKSKPIMQESFILMDLAKENARQCGAGLL